MTDSVASRALRAPAAAAHLRPCPTTCCSACWWASPHDDHFATAAACRAFATSFVARGSCASADEYGFAERGIIILRQGDACPLTPVEIHEIRIAGKGVVASINEDLIMNTFSSSTTVAGARLFVSTLEPGPHLILAVDGSTRRWSRFATLPLSQSLHCMEWHGGLLYVAGGVGGDNREAINTFRAFNEATGSWEDLPPMPYACALAISGVIGNELFVAGGIGNNFDLSTLQIYDFTTQTWRMGAPLPHTQCGECGVVVDDGSYILSLDPAGTRRMLVYDVQSNTWTEQQGPPAGRTLVINAFAHNGRIVALNEAGSAFQRGTGSDRSRFDLADVQRW